MNNQATLDNLNKKFYLLCIGVALVIFTPTSGVPVIPKMMETFDLSPGYAAWPQGFFAVAMVVFQPLFGWIADNYGQRRVGILGASLMLIGSVILAVSPVIGFWLAIVGYAFTGISFAATFPLAYNFIGKYYGEEERGKKIGTMFAIIFLFNAIAPLKGGVFTDLMHWSYNYWASALLAIVAIFMIALSLPNDVRDIKYKFDISGSILMFVMLVALGSIALILNATGTDSIAWMPSLGIFFISLIVLYFVQKKKKDPLLDIDYIRNRHFWGPAAITLFYGLVTVSLLYLLTFYIQNVLGKPSIIAGTLQFVFSLGLGISAYICGRVLIKISARMINMLGVIFVSTGFAMLAFLNTNTSMFYITILVIIASTGAGILNTGLKPVVLAEANPARLGVITFTFNTVENIVKNIGGTFVLITYSLLAVTLGDGAVPRTALYLMIFTAIGLIFIPAIPKRVAGFKRAKGLAQNVEIGRVESNVK
ncbi:MFS transporter [Neobacillus novalis]|uniref:MFS transporter n=1 Tax=Neobacillus novalis TaxID=220687 RepID=A0AA95MKS9_9BACI|nr:MFS transporter [Neobacillus novalis]WHY83948.1 MFS transporter [Neobacillus novalis]